MRILMLGVNYRTAPVELREKISFDGDRLDHTLTGLCERYQSTQIVILSTCNRTELYVARPDGKPPNAAQLIEHLAAMGDVDAALLTPVSIQREGEEAVRHLFRVAAGLDSMVLGEPQVLGQVKRAYERAAACGAAGPAMHAMFQQAIAAAKRVRTQTGIADGRVSVGSVAADFAKQIFDRFDDKTIVAVGAGEMIKLAMRHMIKIGPGKLWVINRSVDRARALVDDLGISASTGGARAFDDLDQLLVDADVVLTSTGSRKPIIDVKRFRPLVRRRKHRPIFIVDIALPRDVAADVGQLPNVYLYDLDDLQKVVARTHEQRSGELEQCEQIVRDAVSACYEQLQNRDISELIRKLRELMHDISEVERSRTLRKIESSDAMAIPDAVREILKEHNHRMINKILHMPMHQLNNGGSDVPLGFYAAALRRLFGLDDSQESKPSSATAPAPPGPQRHDPPSPQL